MADAADGDNLGLLVMKFGGTSIGSAARVRDAAQLVAAERDRPRVVVVEYNAGFPPAQAWIHPYEPGRAWDGTQAFGASLKAWVSIS